jgi:hypothetical protein
MEAHNAKVESITTHHTNAPAPVREGMTLREALEAIRAHRDTFGGLGGLSAELSDGSQLVVECRRRRMGSQRIERRRFDAFANCEKLLRVYPW